MPETKKVQIQGFKFDPDRVEIAVGDSVEWTNLDSTVHTASRDEAPEFDSGSLSKNQSHTETFDEVSPPEGFEYFCRPHPSMKGRIIIARPAT